MERILPTGDLGFKKALASEDTKDILSGLIQDFFCIVVPEKEITLENPYSIEAYQEFVNGDEVSTLRHTIKDVAATFKVANFISEVQVAKTKFFDERALYYPFDRFCKNYNTPGSMEIMSDGKFNRYSSLRPVYALNILGYNHFKDSADHDALRIFELYDPKRGKRYKKDLLFIGFFELKKPNIETINQQHWRDYFNSGEVSDSAPDYIKKASRIIAVANLSEEERKMATMLEKAQADYDAQITSSYYYGLEDKAKEMAKKMLKRGEPIGKIAEYTDLPLEEIEAL